MIILSDLHLREESRDVILREVLPTIRAIALRDKDHRVAILGDVFHIRYRVQVDLFNAFRDELLSWNQEDTRVTIIPGNHDQVDVAGRHALEAYDDLPNVRVYTRPTWDEHGLWFPYRRPDLVADELRQAIAKYDPGRPLPQVLFIHHGVRGAWMNDGHQDQDGIDAAMLSSFSMVICGHYHKAQWLGKRMAYVGSPYEVDAGETCQPKGYATWRNGVFTHVPQLWGPRHHRVRLAAGESLDVARYDKRDDVRVEVATTADAERIGALLANNGFARHTVTPAVAPIEARLQPANESVASYARAYAELTAPADLDRAKLFATFEEVLR